jgi:hypothetical protein
MRGRPCFTEHLLEFAREKQGGNAAVLFTALFSFCPIIDPAWRVRAVRHLKRGFMSVFHWIEKIPIRMEYITVSHASPAQDLYWFLEKRRATRLQHPPPPQLAGVAALPGQPAPGGQHRVRPCPPPKLAALWGLEAASGGPAVRSGLTYSVFCGHSGRGRIRPSPRPP